MKNFIASMALLEWQKQSFFNFPLIFVFISVLAIILLNLFFSFRKKNNNKSRTKLPPSPPKLPLIGNLNHILGSLPHESLHKLAKKFGPIMFLQLGQVPTVVVSSPRLAKEVLRTNDHAIANRPQIFSAKHLFYDCTDMVFSPLGNYWRNIRRICILELLSPKRVQSFSFVREEEVGKLVRRVAESRRGTTNLTNALALYVNNLVCRVAFGRDFSEGGDHIKHNFKKLLEEYQILLGGFSIGDFFPSLEFLHKFTGMESRLKNTFRRFDLFFDEILKDHQNPEGSKDQKDLVDVLLEVQQKEDAENHLTTNNIKAIILDMFAAGTDTNFITLDWAMTELILNPKVLGKAQEEVRNIVGERRIVSESDLPQLQYMKAVIKETFRLHPPAPVLVPRESTEEVTIDGYTIPAKTRYFINAWAIGRDPEIWESPEKFIPERFENSNIDYKGQDFELIPFGAGRRICPAVTFSKATVELALAQLLHSFDWELPPGVEAKDLDMTEVFGITMHKISPLIVIANPRFPEDLS